MSDPASLQPDQHLTDRVLARVKAAARARGRRRSTDRDAQALRRVFLDMGDCYRTYRKRTGEPVVSEVRDAALRFRRDLDLSSLVSVAATLQRVNGEMLS
jgi:hypothetical protein